MIYPTLAWLEDMGYATIVAEGGRKQYSITPDGQAFLDSNTAAVEDIKARGGEGGRHMGRGRFGEVPVGVLRAMENLKVAVKLRLKRGAIDEASAKVIADALGRSGAGRGAELAGPNSQGLIRGRYTN